MHNVERLQLKTKKKKKKSIKSSSLQCFICSCTPCSDTCVRPPSVFLHYSQKSQSNDRLAPVWLYAKDINISPLSNIQLASISSFLLLSCCHLPFSFSFLLLFFLTPASENWAVKAACFYFKAFIPTFLNNMCWRKHLRCQLTRGVIMNQTLSLASLENLVKIK